MTKPKQTDKAETVDEMRSRLRHEQSITNEIIKNKDRGIKMKDFQSLKFTDPVMYSEYANEFFVQLVRSLIEEGNGITNAAVIYQEAAFEMKLNTESVKRYLFRHSARRAEFMTYGKMVMLNPRYRPDESPEDEANAESPE